jgi:cation transport ATPase
MTNKKSFLRAQVPLWEQIPVDGLIVSGMASIDQQM